MGNISDTIKYLMKSKFLRSIFIRIVAVFLVVLIAVETMVFFSFTSEINKNIIEDKNKQLSIVVDTISSRMEEVASITYNIGVDENFFLEAVSGEKYSGYEMTTALSRYLVGNDFIDYIAYYRLSEPEKIYTSSGELSFHAFYNTYLNFSEFTESEYLSEITSCRGVNLLPLADGSRESYFTYVCPYPQLSSNPQAFIIVLIPFSEVEPMLASQLSGSRGKICIFNADGTELCEKSNLDAPLPTSLMELQNEDRTITPDGREFVIQREVSKTNGWIYISAVRLNDIMGELVTKQIVFIVLLLVLFLIATTLILIDITRKYRPISNLALETAKSKTDEGIIDEKELLSDTIATLKGDSEQKEKFESAYHEAQAASRAKSAFLSSMSHDIRTPMNAIIGMNELALKRPEDTEHVKECLQKVRVASKYLLDIINNVLDMSRIESGKFTLSEEEISLSKLIYELITISHPNIEEKGLRLRIETKNVANETVFADGIRLTQIFMNILSNAVKFTPSGGTIKVKIIQAERSHDATSEYTFVFSDTGIGMSPEFVERVFDTFSRADAAGTTRAEGTGLGMAIAKNLVELMGGEITCESKLNKGTTFTVKLNLRHSKEASNKTHYEKYSGARVIIAAELKDDVEAERSVFKELGVNADSAVGVDEFGEKIKSAEQPYDYIVINRTEKGKNEEYFAAARSGKENNRTKIILVSSDLIGVNGSTSSKADGYVQLPLFRSSVISILENRTDDMKQTALLTDTIPSFNGKRLLIVEDNAINQEIACSIIRETGAEIVTAHNGREAVEAYVTHSAYYFDAILMDLQMPEMNGYEATAVIRSLKRADSESLPIYALTANTFAEDVKQVVELGMNGHIGKPYTPESLYEKLSEILR